MEPGRERRVRFAQWPAPVREYDDRRDESPPDPCRARRGRAGGVGGVDVLERFGRRRRRGGRTGAPTTTQPSSGGPLTTVARPSTKKPTPTTAPAPTTTVAPNPAAYSTALFGFWKQRDRDGADTIATVGVVKLLFSQRWHAIDGWVTQPCRSALGSTYCVWARPGRKYVFQVRNPAGGRPPQVIGLQRTN